MMERTEKPTPRRLRRARQEGMVMHSPLVGAGLAIVGLGVLGLLGPGLFSGISSLFELVQGAHDAARVPWGRVLGWVVDAGLAGFVLLLLGAFLLNPRLVRRASFMKVPVRLPAVRDGLVRGLSALVVLVFLGFVGHSFLKERYLHGAGVGAWTGAWRSIMHVLVLTGVVLSVLGYWHARRRYMASLMMSRQDLRDEARESEGSPEARRERSRRMKTQ